ncbi:MAG: phytanoyl-CoA dioxygenase family protein [Candidatus Latescibacterota bacterium]|nr:phytanoyl-CoA dioxygenase family protein [Candidatus Latescibacterota bacterium]
MTIAPTRLNPDPNPELERDVSFFLKWGYLVVEEAITAEQMESLRVALDAAFERKQETFIHQLLEEDERFVFLVDNLPVLQRMQAILGNCVQLHSATARITEEGAEDQNWHRDGPWPMDGPGTAYGSLPAQINCGYFLDELTMENGPIVIVPGSHRAPFKPPEGHPRFPDEMHVLAKPGQAVMFDGWLYHRGAANRTGRRRVCLMCYQNAWMKSREPFDGPVAKRLREQGTDVQKLLMGGIDKW